MVSKVASTVDDTVLTAEIPTEPGMGEKASSIPVTVALTSVMASSSVPVVAEPLGNTKAKNDSKIANVVDSTIEVSALPVPVTPQDSNVDGIHTPFFNRTFEHQVKLVAPEQPVFSRPSDVKTDIVTIDDVAPDALEDILSADKATMPDKVPMATKNVPFVEDATGFEGLQTVQREAILGDESVTEEGRPEIAAPIAEDEVELKNIPIIDSVQSHIVQEPPTVVTTSDMGRIAVVGDAVVIEKAPFVGQEERVRGAQETPVSEAIPATVTSGAPDVPSASIPEVPILEEESVEQLIGADATGQSVVVADKIPTAEGASTAESANVGEEDRGKEDLQLVTTIAAKVIPIENETPAVSVIRAAVKEGEAMMVEAGKDELEKIPVVQADPIVEIEVKELDEGGELPPVEIPGEPSPLEAPIVEVATDEIGLVEVVHEGSSTVKGSVVIVPLVEGPTSAEDVSIEAVRISEQAMTGEQPSTTTVLAVPFASEESLLEERDTFEESPAVEKVIISGTPDVKDAPVIAEHLSLIAQTSVVEEPLGVPIVVSAQKLSTGADGVEEEISSLTPVAKSTAEVNLAFARDESIEAVEPLDEAHAAHVPFIRQPSTVEMPVSDVREHVKTTIAEETYVNEAAVILAGDSLVIEEVAGEQVVTGIHNTKNTVELLIVHDASANQQEPVEAEVVEEASIVDAPVAIPTETSAVETEIPVKKGVPTEDSPIVEEIIATHELSAVEQGVEVLGIFTDPPTVEEVLEEVSFIEPSPAVGDGTVVDVQVEAVPVAELALNDDISQKVEKHVFELHTSESRDPAIQELMVFEAKPLGGSEKAIAVLTPPVECASLDDIHTANAAPLVAQASATLTAADELPTAEGRSGGDPVVADSVVFEKPAVIGDESIIKVGADVDQSHTETPVGADTEKAHIEYAPIEGIAISKVTAEARLVVEAVVSEPPDAKPLGDSVSDEKRTTVDGPLSIVASVVERIGEDGNYAAARAETTIGDAPDIKRNPAEEATAQYALPSQVSSTEGIVAPLKERSPEDGETQAPVDQAEPPTVIGDSVITQGSVVEDSILHDSSAVEFIQAPVVTDKADLHGSEIALESTISLDDISVNPVSNLSLTEEEPNVEVAETVSDQDQRSVSSRCNTDDLLTPAGIKIDQSRSPWTPSYSVTTQGPGLPAEEDIPVIENLPLLLPQVPIVALTVVDSSALLDETQSSSELLEERPKSPWTPSYSVSVQGSPLRGTVTLDEIEPVDGAVVSTDRNIPVAGEPAISQTGIPTEVEAATEPPKNRSQEDVVQPQSTLVTGEQPKTTDEVIIAPAAEPVTEKTVDDVKSPDEESTSSKELPTFDNDIEHPASPWTSSFSVMHQGTISTTPEVENTLTTSFHPGDSVSVSSTADKLVITEDITIAESTSTSVTEVVEVEGRDSHTVERPVQQVASPIIETQSERSDGIASTLEPDHSLEKHIDVEVDANSHAEETIGPSEGSQLSIPSTEIERPTSLSTPSYSVQDQGISIAEVKTILFASLSPEDAVGVASVPITEVQSTGIDAGKAAVRQTYIAEAAMSSLPSVAELANDDDDSSFVKTASAQVENFLAIEAVIPTPEFLSAAEADVKSHVQVGLLEEVSIGSCR
ncbi:uncharacterized protein BT62DRAFT_399651 [Guyanagaster necrorhizus]|uniref:Uncharacterized protein n=1 Tax=Guyanagaster necrorhizus TaxID=856835 RepID=A0A9P8AWW7_9AGAR|nr:uncharacterized protein BT62DRAFT_399651 [Guyanagaster necrorhizus MCA 3950]KAG7451129.1 hypothetical protein BT62DRAFT_399651 [Guyanagaster necrorhizus MCA 3950]